LKCFVIFAESKPPLDLPPPNCLRRRGDETVKARETEKKVEESAKEDNSVIPCSLFVCGQGNMALLLVLEAGTEDNPDLILKLVRVNAIIHFNLRLK